VTGYVVSSSNWIWNPARYSAFGSVGAEATSVTASFDFGWHRPTTLQQHPQARYLRQP
jgi:hypothetical protein